LEEYRFRLGVKQRDDIYNKIKAKEACYKRYKAYIKNEIPLEFIAPLNNFWISEILNLIPAKLDLVT
jgi:dynein heavy chain